MSLKSLILLTLPTILSLVVYFDFLAEFMVAVSFFGGEITALDVGSTRDLAGFTHDLADLA
jgi:hypothetical protein